jgi:hypothetical protein
MEYSVLCDRTNTHECSASKRAKFIENRKYDDEEIKNAMENDDYSNLLIGDKTKGHVLPLLESKKHRDLASISSNTVSKNSTVCPTVRRIITKNLLMF